MRESLKVQKVLLDFESIKKKFQLTHHQELYIFLILKKNHAMNFIFDKNSKTLEK